VKLGKYTGIEVKRTVLKVDDRDVNAMLERMRASRAKQVEAKKGHKIAVGNIAVIDFEGFADGVAFDGGKAEDYELEIGSKSFIDTFEDQLIGRVAGDEAELNVTFPKNYHEVSLAGKPVMFKVKVKGVQVRELPALDDAFAKEMGKFKNMAELRADIEKEMQMEADAEAAQADELALIRAVVDNTNVTPPQSMVDRQHEFIMQDMELRLMRQGVDLATYAQMTNTTLEAIREERGKDAIASVKTRLVLDTIAEKEGITVTEADIEAEAKKVAERAGRKVSEILGKPDHRDYLKNDIMFGKIVAFLKEKNKFV